MKGTVIPIVQMRRLRPAHLSEYGKHTTFSYFVTLPSKDPQDRHK